MKQFELDLVKVLRVQSYSRKSEHMSRFICNEITKMGLVYTKDKIGNIYVQKGISKLYPTMVCHIDTVHPYNPNYEVHQSRRKLFAIDTTDCTRLGIGGDDKVGIFMTLKFLSEFDVFKAVFFVDEEIGCVGSRACDFSFFLNSCFVLECDRKGSKDFVSSISTTRLYSKDFSTAISGILDTYGRTEVSGGMTDVLEIADSTNLCVANMSCGYYAPHSDDEYVDIDDVHETYKMCKEMYENLCDEQWLVEDKDRFIPYSYNTYGTYGNKSGFNSYGGYSNAYYGGTDDFDFDTDLKDVHNHKPKESEADIDPKGFIECMDCGGLNAVFDEFDDTVYCYDCQSTMNAIDYLEEEQKKYANYSKYNKYTK